MPNTLRQAVSADPLAEFLTVKRGKWTMSVVMQLRAEKQRFSELRRSIPGISQKALTETLRALERDGFVLRTSFATIPPRVDYELTELGNEVLRIFEAWEDFSQRHWGRVLESRQRVVQSQGEAPRSVDVVIRRAGR